MRGHKLKIKKNMCSWPVYQPSTWEKIPSFYLLLSPCNRKCVPKQSFEEISPYYAIRGHRTFPQTGDTPWAMSSHVCALTVNIRVLWLKAEATPTSWGGVALIYTQTARSEQGSYRGVYRHAKINSLSDFCRESNKVLLRDIWDRCRLLESCNIRDLLCNIVHFHYFILSYVIYSWSCQFPG